MPSLKLILDGDRCWPDILNLYTERKIIDLMGKNAPPIQIAALPGGMASGKISVTIRLDLPDGRVLLTETSLQLLGGAVDAIRAKYEDDES